MHDMPEELARIASPEFQRSQLKLMTQGRQVIVRFKKGGRIAEEHIYDSADEENHQAVMAVQSVLMLGMVKDNDGCQRIKIGPHMIGQGMMGLAPWEFGDLGRIVKNGATPKEQLDFNSPLRISDVIEQNGITIIEVESV